MNYKEVYSYHPETGEYLGVTQAWESPLEPGVYHIPAHATEEKPPEVKEGYKAIWDGEKWELVEIPTELEDLQEPKPQTKEELLEMIRQIRNAKLFECDWTQLPDAPLTEAEKKAWQVYRQSLRDLPQTIDLEDINSIEDVVWPELPS